MQDLIDKIQERIYQAEFDFHQALKYIKKRDYREGVIKLHNAIHHIARALLLTKRIDTFPNPETIHLFGLHFLRAGVLKERKVEPCLAFLKLGERRDVSALIEEVGLSKLYRSARYLMRTARIFLKRQIRLMKKLSMIMLIFSIAYAQIEVTPPGWTKVNKFNLSWKKLHEELKADVIGYYYKLNDEIKYRFTYESEITISVLGDGIHTFYLHPLSIGGLLGTYTASLYYDGHPPYKPGSFTLSLIGTIRTGPYPIDLCCADVNNDGYLDIISTSYEKARIDVFLQNAGTFSLPPSSYEAVKATIFVDGGDLNNDGLDDIVATNAVEGDCISIFFQGGAKLSKQHTYVTDASPYGVRVADINQDKANDILVANLGGGTLGIFIQDLRVETADYLCIHCKRATKAAKIIGGKFKPQKTYPAGIYPYNLAVADIDKDTDLDIAVAMYTWDGVRVFFQESGDFVIKDVYVGRHPTSVAFGDPDGDGDLEIISANLGEGTISIVEYKDRQLLHSNKATSTGGAWGVACFDFDFDGKDEVVVTAPQGLVNLFKLVDGELKIVATTGSGGSSPWGVELADLNKDGLPEIVVINTGGAVGIIKVEPHPR